MKNKQPSEGDLRVWHIPQVPMAAFRVPVENLVEAKLLLDALAEYDLFQLKHHVKPDYANAQGLEVFEDGEWCDWTPKGLQSVAIPDMFIDNIDSLTLEQARKYRGALS